ncbi:MAG: glycosyltransferase family 9 protein [Bdellovibrionia bacterium]
MKILVLQLARFGDIYATWPVLRALKRKYPKAKLHFLVRRHFAEACQGLDAVDRVWAFDTEAILAPVLEESVSIEESLKKLTGYLEILQNEKYDQVINLSFSPASSYLTHMISGPETEIHGYTRFDDGTLRLPDEYSSFFYAQVGIGRPNRVHVVDLMAGVAGCELQPGDWSLPNNVVEIDTPRPFIVIHIGASQERKSYPARMWAKVIERTREWWDGDIVLVGSASEVEKSNAITAECGLTRVIPLVGQTRLPQLFGILLRARVFIGCDSGPLHMASLTKTPVLNLSFASVNFWETGPKSAGSRILWAQSPVILEPEWVSEEAQRMIERQPGRNTRAEVVSPVDFFASLFLDDHEDFEWDLIKALYFGFDMPPLRTHVAQNAILRLSEINNLAIEQIKRIAIDPKGQTPYEILNRADEMFHTVSQLVPDLAPLARWVLTEKARVGPGPLGEVAAGTLAVHEAFQSQLNKFQIDSKEIQL